MNISAGYYYLRVKMGKRIFKGLSTKLKFSKASKISIGSENEDSEWKE